MESVSTWLNSYMDTFIVSLFLTTYYVGLYKTSMVTVNQITSIIVSATSMPLFVALSRLETIGIGKTLVNKLLRRNERS